MDDWPINNGGKFACPYCGYHTLTEIGGSFDICWVCSWEEDCIGFDPTDTSFYGSDRDESPIWDTRYWGSANYMTVEQGRENFDQTGSSEVPRRVAVRKPNESELPRHDWKSDRRLFRSDA